MLTENGLEIDREAMEEVLRKADVLTIGFTTFPERMLVDFRHRAGVEPWSGIVEPVATVQERFAWLGRIRGTLGAPEAFSFFIWPHSARTLVEVDGLATVRGRLAEASPEAAGEFAATLRAVRKREREAYREAVAGGAAYHTLWTRRQ